MSEIQDEAYSEAMDEIDRLKKSLEWWEETCRIKTHLITELANALEEVDSDPSQIILSDEGRNVLARAKETIQTNPHP